MKEFEYIITDADGIHARPAGEFVKAAKIFNSSIEISKGDKQADAKKIFGVMGLAAKHGDMVKITIEGEDEDKAALSLQEFMKKNL